MEALRQKARELLEKDAVKVVIGYAPGSAEGRVRTEFVRKAEDTDKLICDKTCVQNLGVYLTKAEVKAIGKPAVVAKPGVVRTILQLASEQQMAEGSVVALAVDMQGNVQALETFAEMETYVAAQPWGRPDRRENAEKIQALPAAERWKFWQDQFANCLKCYACRAACPMCYCSRCITECNQPQWIPVAPHPLGNFEWHAVRAMHLTGRCIGCGACAEACPVGIPLDALSFAMAAKAEEEFGGRAGQSASRDYAMSSFKPDDKENFIK